MLAYTRCSTEEQATGGYGLGAQRDAIDAEAVRRGWEVEHFADEGKSGKYINPALRDVLDLLAAGQGDGLVVAKLDRLARSVGHADDILRLAQQQGWALVVLDLGVDLTTPAGRMVAQVMATFAEFEREMISQRTKDGLARARREGKRLGRRPLAKPGLVRRIVIDRDEAGLSFARIARGLEAEGIPSPEGRPTWQPSTVRRIYQSATTSVEAVGA